MAINKSVDFMLTFVREYLDGETERFFFDLDFNHYLIQHYTAMERYNVNLAQCFYFYLAEEGVDRTKDLSDAEHKKLIRRQFKKFMDAWHDGFC